MEWISVEDSKPEYQYISGIRFYYVNVVASGLSLIACFDAKEKCFVECPHGYEIAVTHWMPLPEPPKD